MVDFPVVRSAAFLVGLAQGSIQALIVS